METLKQVKIGPHGAALVFRGELITTPVMPMCVTDPVAAVVTAIVVLV